MAKAGNGSGTHHVVPNPNGGWDVRRGGADGNPGTGTLKPQVKPSAAYLATRRGALKMNAALTSLNLASNNLHAEGARHVAEAIKGHVSVLQFV